MKNPQTEHVEMSSSIHLSSDSLQSLHLNLSHALLQGRIKGSGAKNEKLCKMGNKGMHQSSRTAMPRTITS